MGTLLYPKGGDPALQGYDHEYDVVTNAQYFLGDALQLLRGRRPQALARVMDAAGVGEDELLSAFDLLVAGFERFAADQSVRDPRDLVGKLKDSGYLECPPEAQMMVQAALGQVVMRTMAFGLKDRARLGEVSPLVEVFRRLGERAREVEPGPAPGAGGES